MTSITINELHTGDTFTFEYQLFEDEIIIITGEVTKLEADSFFDGIMKVSYTNLDESKEQFFYVNGTRKAALVARPTQAA